MQICFKIRLRGFLQNCVWTQSTNTQAGEILCSIKLANQKYSWQVFSTQLCSAYEIKYIVSMLENIRGEYMKGFRESAFVSNRDKT